MTTEIKTNVPVDDIFVSEKNSFMVTENMEVEFASIVSTLKTLRGLGYKNLDNMEEMFVDVGHKEVLALLECLFSSDTPLTDKWDTDLDDIEVHVVNISKAEANNLVRASLMTSTALTTALGCLLLKKPKAEKL
ncbi:hypothetical protein AALP_AA1G121800 [Arabis alpina]|uniref:Uncharacterized protein n=1 Tax=Arabis alpina TaxID=50452 RepID=A0A087HMQ3_ARAAL|nr:hypothetical protein AALP_AA1G121800 [Arabis alpina]